MINICFPLFDKYGTYSKYEGVALYSLLGNTKEKVRVHVLCDETVSEDNRNKLFLICREFSQELTFHDVSLPESLFDLSSLKNFTIGTLFRLKLAEVLPQDIDELIYLDADLVINLDIAELWNIDIGDNYVLAMKDSGFYPTRSRWLFSDGILSWESYFNAGVMKLNLKKIRVDFDLLNDAMVFLMKYPEVPYLDQDALNYLFAGKVGFIPEYFNRFTSQCRKKSEQLKPAIYHFAGDHPYAVPKEPFDILFFDYLGKTPWGDPENISSYYRAQLLKRDESISIFRDVLKNSRGKQLVFWGATGLLTETIVGMFDVTEGDFFVDNNERLFGKSILGMPVYSPSKIADCIGQVFVVVISNLWYREIKQELEKLGLKEHADFIDGRWLLREDEFGYYAL